MATTYNLTAQYTLALAAQYVENLAQNSVVDRLQAGNGSFTKLTNSLSYGTSANKAHVLWHDQRTVAGTTNDDLVLGSGGSLKDAFGNALAFTNIRWVLIRLISPATGNRLVVGNQGANAVQLWFGATTHTEEVRSLSFHENQIDGWTVAANGTLRINNPTAGSLTYDIVVIGY